MGAEMDDETRKRILALLGQHRIMTIATLRPDGWPHATTVSYVNEGFTLYFLCGLHSQKATNLARSDRVSLTIADDMSEPMAITGLSMAARASGDRCVRSGQGPTNAAVEVSRTGVVPGADVAPAHVPRRESRNRRLVDPTLRSVGGHVCFAVVVRRRG